MPQERPTDAELIRRARTGDEAAFAALVERWFGRIHRWALGIVGDFDDAEDVTQQVLIRLHLKLERFQGRAAFSTWLYQMTRNTARDAFRRQRRRLENVSRLPLVADVEDPDADQAAAVERQEAAAAARAALARLPLRQREVFDLVELQGYEPIEAATLLELSPGTVRAHLFRARRAVRAAMLAANPSVAEELTC